ncbi:replication initiator protein A [Campylobacter sp.]|uniref:replication initiator protein A n=1 Tax=Campylobacter sp. TaxID=205 RepID=UPI002AA882AE|nr:replication initiator protein A [Campylobacter sp.]MCI6661588.1 replication initiator protein A [Campylobacter sp.]
MSYSKFYDDIKAAKMSSKAKILYTILLDKYELSAKKGFTNAKGQIICKMKQVEMAEAMGCGVRSVPKYIDELKLHNLILVEFGLCKMYEIQVFQIGKNCSFKTAKIADLNLQELPIQNGKNCTSLTYKPDPLSQLTKPNARIRTHEASQNQPSQTQPSERASSHSFSESELGELISQSKQSELRIQNERIAQSEPSKQSEQKTQSTLGNSRIPSQAQAQGKTQNQTPSQDKTQAQAQTQTQTRSQAQTQTQDKPQAPSTARQWLGINDKPSYISEQTWQDFCAYKRERRHNFTATGKKAFFAKLDDIEAKSGACETAIKNTMANGWQGVFMPPLDKSLGKGQGMKPAQMVDALQEWLSDRQAQVIESVESIQSEQGEQELPQALPSRERRA